MRKNSANFYESFGRKIKDVYQIVERHYEDESIRFFVKIIMVNNENTFKIGFEDILFHDDPFDTYGQALDFITELKKQNRKYMVKEEIIHEINGIDKHIQH